MIAIFKLDKKNNIELYPGVLALCPDLNLLSGEEVKYVIYVYDYIFSPWRALPIDERKRKAIYRIYGDKQIIPEDNPKVAKAIKEYREMIYDSRYETLENLITKINYLNNLISKEAINIKDLKDNMDMINTLTKHKEAIERDLSNEEEKMYLKGGKELSHLEKWQRKVKSGDV